MNFLQNQVRIVFGPISLMRKTIISPMLFLKGFVPCMITDSLTTAYRTQPSRNMAWKSETKGCVIYWKCKDLY